MTRPGPLNTVELRWSYLALQFADDLAMLFDAPSSEYFDSGTSSPDEYLKVIRSLGACHFTQFSGHILWPPLIAQVGHEIASLLHDHTTPSDIKPFFDHQTGDYDCWMDTNYDNVFYFAHETIAMKHYSQGGFANWFEKRFLEFCR